MNKIIVIKKVDMLIKVSNIQYCSIVNDGVDITMANDRTIRIASNNPKKLYNLIKCFIIDNTENYVLEID